MHSVLRNAVSTLNFLLLQQSTDRLSLPECVIDEISLYIDGLDDLLLQKETSLSLQPLADEIKDIIKKELEEGLYLDESPNNVKAAIQTFYRQNCGEYYKSPSLNLYNSIVDEVVSEREQENSEHALE